jgi:probable rRNA maturation factor
MIKFSFVNETKARVSGKHSNEVMERFYKIMKKKIDGKLGKRHGEIDLILVDDRTIKAMNKEYRDENKVTDVISFAYLEVTDYKKQKGDVIVGDIFISVDVAKKQAKSHKHTLSKELEILFVHGLLHLFGFDHKTKKQEQEMEKWASKVLND